MDFDWLNLFWIVPLCIVPAFAVLIIGVSLWEKHPIRPFDAPAEDEEAPADDYADRMNMGAADEGFEFLGTAKDNRGGPYRLWFDFWASEDRTVFAVVAGGTLLRLPFKMTALYSALPGGRYLQTTDNVGDVDVGGRDILQIWPGASFGRLADKHNDRLDHLTGDDPPPFGDGHPLRTFIDIRRREAAYLVERGLARYADPEQSAFRYSFRGAVWFYVMGQWVQPLGRLGRTLGLSRY